jgi:hypothetical protein
MPKVVVKGESVYKCDICTRSIRVPSNPRGLDVLQRCIITHNCPGKLSRVLNAKDINATPAFPPEVQGVTDWFQRRVFYTHQQPVQSQTWTVKHNLAARPTVYVYVNRIINEQSTLVEIQPVQILTVDQNTIKVVFETAETGSVQCVSLTSQNSINPASTESSSQALDIQITSDAGELTIATLSAGPLVGIGLTFKTSGVSTDTLIDYAGISTVPSTLSPWAGTQRVVINGALYTVRSFNITTTPLAPAYFAAGAIPNGSAFYVNTFNSAPTRPGQCLFLLGRAPYATVDRIYDQYIDASSISATNPKFYYTAGKAYSSTDVIRTTYPPILVV